MTAREIYERLLSVRGITDPDIFANPDYNSLADPFFMPDMNEAVERISSAIESGQKIAIYGDYDIDGMTATTILTEAIQMFGAEVLNFIPSRFIDGYGMGKRGVDELHQQNVKLIITVDTGSLSHKEIEYAKSLGIDVIVTDHHTVGDTLPDAIAVINPKREDSKYPYKDMAGVGVAFTLIRALQTKLPGLERGQEKWFLDLVAMGTVCDVVPLTGENRILVFWGLHVLKQTRRPGLRALASVSGTDLGAANPETFGFRFGPRLNASGRLDTAKLSMQVLAAQNVQDAMLHASKLEDQNTERRRLQNAIAEAALEQARYSNDNIIVVAGEGWSHGVVGIVASRLVEELQKPAFVIGINEGKGVGSARSFGDYHLAHAIKNLGDVLEKGGGHAMAAGITILPEQIDAFRERINQHFADVDIEEQRKQLGVVPDLELETFEGLDEELIGLLDALQPFGVANPQPLFRVPVTVADWRGVGATGAHAKATLVDSGGTKRDAIGFNLTKKMPEAGQQVDALFHLEINEWNGRRSVQHKLIDIIK